MNINSINLFPFETKYKNNTKTGYYPNLMPLSKDTVSFGAMKKSKFDGLDLIAVNKFKIPIEKFNTNDDLQTWCSNKLLNDYNGKTYIAKYPEITPKRSKILGEWFDKISDKNCQYSKSSALIMIDSITSPLKKNNNVLPPIYNEDVVVRTLNEIQDKSKINKNLQIDFNKLYQKNLSDSLLSSVTLSDNGTPENVTGWVEIPSLENDSKNFEQNVEKLKTLSAQGWCTKSTRTDKYLEKGDFHIYLENGKPQIGVMFIGDEIEEIQGANNNGRIPVKYLDITKEHIKDYNKSEKTIKEIIEADKAKSSIDEFLNKLGKPVNEASIDELFQAADLFEKRDNDGLIILKSYSQPSEHFSWNDIEVNDCKLFKDVKEIKGNADFRGSNIINLGNLKTIGGSAIIRGSRIENLGELSIIKGNADFKDSIIKNLNNLEEIGGYVDFTESKIENLGNLKRIGLDAYFENSEITSLGNLEEINGNADFSHSKVRDLGKLQKIGGNAYFSHSDVEDISGLKDVGGRIKLRGSKINPLDIIEKGFSMM